ncbi:MAG: hypothetical protein KA436_03675 [Oligoflexales bacterium]|nr:hypothetical protein [Oligoflexales bacterium]
MTSKIKATGPNMVFRFLHKRFCSYFLAKKFNFLFAFLLKFSLMSTLMFALCSCQALFSSRKITQEGLILPYIKNTANECYYLDEFMPTPNHLVTGKAGSLNLRYYTYNSASYKDWREKQIVLSFYSKDERCWSLFEEFFVLE